MRKIKLLIAAAAFFGSGISANAQGWTASEPATGDFYLYNVGANAYLENGANWTTHAALKSSGFVVNVTANNGVYTIGTNRKYVGKFFTDNGYVDTGGSTNWIFEPVAGMTNTYKLKTANGSYAYAANGMYQVEIGTDPGTAKGYWKLVTAENRDAATGASATNPIEWTHKVSNPRFDDNNDGWQNPPTRGGKVANTWQADASLFNDFNPCAEHFSKEFDTYQELTNMPNGIYAISAQGFYREGGYQAAAPKHVDGTESLNAILYANGGGEDATQPLVSIFEEAGKASGGSTKTATGISGAFPDDMVAASYFFSAGLYWNTVYVEVTNGTLKFGIKKSTTVGDDWTIFDNFRLQYFGDCTIADAKFGAFVVALNEAVAAAKGFINSNPALSDAQIATLQKIINDNDNDDNAFTEENQFTTATETINNALAAYQAMVAPYANFNALLPKAEAIAAVEYKETTSGSHTTFANAISAQATAVDKATSAATITEASNALIAAIKTYIAGAEPKNDGKYFDITCLMVNPNFDDSHNGWTYIDAPGVSWSNCEYYEKEFDINQTVTGLPTGSYSLSVQAYQRPGWAGNVYNDYINGTDNASSVLYINSITSNVKNIMADAQTTGKLGPDGEGKWGGWPNDSQVGSEGNYKYVPNSQQGANLYFAAGLYDATCAAVVDDAANGSLKLGFKSTKTHVSGDWTIFDNFRLYYYGSSKMIYYKQYLPQLEAEIAENYLNNAVYAVLKDGQPQRTALATANSADANTLTTETQFEQAIAAIIAARDAFTLAKTAYDNLALGLASSTYNVGDGVFQMSSSQATTFASEISNGTTMYQTGTAGLQQVTAQILAISNAYVLNAPDANKRYKLTLTSKGALTFAAGGQADEGGYENPFMDANDNLAQHFTLTKVQSASNPNIYTLSFVDLDGNTRYICAGEKAKAGLGNERIRTTTTADDALQIVIIATNTEGVFNMYNKLTNSKMGSNGGGLYTSNDVTDWTIAEADQAIITINTTAAGYGTLILPFATGLPSDVTAYTCEEYSGDQLTVVEATSIEANKPYILEGSWNEKKEGWGLGAAVENKVGLLTGVYAETPAPVGSYVMQKNNDKVGFFRVADGKQPTVGANHIYVTVSGEGSARAAFFFDGGETTGIDAINALANGDAQIYNTNGVQLPRLQKGMNIVKMSDGSIRKIMVK